MCVGGLLRVILIYWLALVGVGIDMCAAILSNYFVNYDPSHHCLTYSLILPLTFVVVMLNIAVDSNMIP